MRVSWQKVLYIHCILFLCSSHVFPLDLDIQVTPSSTIPLGPASTPYYSIGFGSALNAGVDLLDMIAVGPELGYYMNPLLNTGKFATFVNGGISLGMYFYPTSRMKVQAGASGGAYQVAYKSDTFSGTYGNLWWKVYANAGYRISPTFSVGGNLGYINFAGDSEPMYTGLLAGVSAQLQLNTVKTDGNIDVTLDQTEPVFPLFYVIYKQNSIGTLKITNHESAEIRNVTVSFRAANYTSSAIECGKADMILKRKSVEIPLYADFAPTIQNFTENGKIPGEVIITYQLLGADRETSKTLIVPVYNRNAVRWTDTAVLASYISPNAPEVLDYSKFAVGVARDQLRTGLNRNMQFAMYLFEGLKVGGLSYSRDDATPYVKYHQDSEKLDYIQYPFQTLAYHSGDYDDLGILFAAALESVGIRAAIIPLKDDFVVAFSLGITAAEAESLFSGTENLLTISDEIWIPLSFSVLREGFVNSWYNAMNGLNAAMANNDNLDFIILEEAWRTYPPANIKGSEAQFQKPLETSLADAVNTDLLRYISTEFGPKILEVQNQIRTAGGSTQLYNQLGLLYVRTGMYAEAKAEYKKSAALKSASAMINLGNIATLEKDFKTAAKWYTQALAIQPESKAARNGLERAQTELKE